jgi:hypothetical protein
MLILKQIRIRIKKYIWHILPEICMGLLLLITSSCRKEDAVPTLTTLYPPSFWISGDYMHVECGGEILDDGGSPLTARGVCWSKEKNPTLKDSYVNATLDGTDDFLCYIFPIYGVTAYYIRAFATNKIGTGYGNEIKYTTGIGWNI